jgi:hypothetical protein
VWLKIITNKRQNDCLHTDLIFVQNYFHPHGDSVPDDAREGENYFVQILNQCVDNHFAFYLL